MFTTIVIIISTMCFAFAMYLLENIRRVEAMLLKNIVPDDELGQYIYELGKDVKKKHGVSFYNEQDLVYRVTIVHVILGLTYVTLCVGAWYLG